MSRDPLWDALKQASKDGKKHRQETNLNKYEKMVLNLDRSEWHVVQNKNGYHFTVTHRGTKRKAQCWPVSNKWMDTSIHRRCTFGIQNMINYLSGVVDHAPHYKPGKRQ